MKNSIVLKVGGSLIYNDDLTLNNSFLLKLKEWVISSRDYYDSIILVVGGGKIARDLINKYDQISIANEVKHRVGITCTHLNVELLYGLLQDEIAEITLPKSLGEGLESVVYQNSKVLIVGGFKPGWSTDKISAIFTDALDLKSFYKLSNIQGVYDEDPRDNPDATLISDMTWQNYAEQFGMDVDNSDSQKPGLNSPVGAPATAYCLENGISLRVTGGESLSKSSITEILQEGTLIHP